MKVVFSTVLLVGALFWLVLYVAQESRFPKIDDPDALVRECRELVLQRPIEQRLDLVLPHDWPPEIRRLEPHSVQLGLEHVLIRLGRQGNRVFSYKVLINGEVDWLPSDGCRQVSGHSAIFRCVGKITKEKEI